MVDPAPRLSLHRNRQFRPMANLRSSRTTTLGSSAPSEACDDDRYPPTNDRSDSCCHEVLLWGFVGTHDAERLLAQRCLRPVPRRANAACALAATGHRYEDTAVRLRAPRDNGKHVRFTRVETGHASHHIHRETWVLDLLRGRERRAARAPGSPRFVAFCAKLRDVSAACESAMLQRPSEVPTSASW